MPNFPRWRPPIACCELELPQHVINHVFATSRHRSGACVHYACCVLRVCGPVVRAIRGSVVASGGICSIHQPHVNTCCIAHSRAHRCATLSVWANGDPASRWQLSTYVRHLPDRCFDVGCSCVARCVLGNGVARCDAVRRTLHSRVQFGVVCVLALLRLCVCGKGVV